MSSRVIDHWLIIRDEPYYSPFKNFGDYFDEMYSCRDFVPDAKYKEDRQKDMPQGDPHSYWDYIDPRQYE